MLTVEIVSLVTAIALLIGIAALTFTLYRKCGPNQAMLITGMFAQDAVSSYKIVVGGGAVVLPVVQQVHFLSLEMIQVDVYGQTPLLTKDEKLVGLDGIGQVKVGPDLLSMATAAEMFIGKDQEYIANIARDHFLSNIRAVVGTLTFEELNSNLLSVSQRVQEITILDLSKMGLVVLSFKLKELERVN